MVISEMTLLANFTVFPMFNLSYSSVWTSSGLERLLGVCWEGTDMALTEVSLKLIIGLCLLFLLVHLTGKKLIDQITPFHFVSAIVLSELVGDATYNKDIPVLYVPFAICLWGAILYIIDYISMKSHLFRKWVEGKPVMVIRNGQVDYEQMKKSRINLNQLQSMLRQSETFSIREVAYAFIEPNGSLSILKKSPYQKTTQEDFRFPEAPVHMPMTLIRDGEIIKDNLNELGKDKSWLLEQLEPHGVTHAEDVLFAEWLETDGLFVVPHQCVSKT